MQHQQVCPDCGSSGTVQLIAEIGEKVCSNCATVSHDLQIYEPTNVHEVAYALGAPQERRASSSFPLAPTGPIGWSFWSNNCEHQRRWNGFQRKPEVDARIKGTLNTLGYPGLFEQVDFLFKRARDESWRRPQVSSFVDEADKKYDPFLDLLPPSLVVPRVKWGNGSLLLATACCYAVLRREGVRIDLATVANAAQLPFHKVRTAFKRLHLLVKGAVRDIKLANPDAYVRRILAFFYFHLLHKTTSALAPAVIKFLQPFQCALPSASGFTNVDDTRIFNNTPFEAVEATAIDLCAFWWPHRTRPPSNLAQLAAYAIVVFALEAHIKATAPIREIFRYTHAAIEFDPVLVRSGLASASQLGSQAILNKTAVESYRELCAALKLQAIKIPWLSDATPINKTRRSKRRSKASKAVASTDTSSAASDDLARLDVIVHAIDILDVWRTRSSKHIDAQRPDSRLDLAQAPSSSSAATPASQETTDHDCSEGEHSDRAMDNDDMDCFVSASLPSTAIESCQEHPADTQLADAATKDANDEVWPRVQQRLEAAGALEKKDEPANHPIDRLTDDQVDRLLFDADELPSLFRTDPMELAAFEQAKVAAGDWTIQSDHQRNAEIAALAQSLEQKPAPARKIKGAREDSMLMDVAEAIGSKTVKRRKQTTSSPSSSVAAETQSLSTTEPSKRQRAAAVNVSLRDQQEESDWSD